MEFISRFEQYWSTNKFPPKNNTILVAVSGGKDSMCLAYLLHQLEYSIAVAHCNFQLRAQESDLDEKLVKQWTAEQGIQCHVIRFDTNKEMENGKTGIQETARNLRYEWFKSLCTEHHYAAIATAHHANDNAETLIMNLCKGTGIAGLHGILPNNNNIIRPLLFADSKDITQFVEANNIPFRDDASNTSDKYLRNAVRHKIIPELQNLFPNVVQQINDTISRIRQSEIVYRQSIDKELKKMIERRGKDYYVPILKLQKHTAQEAICYEIFTQFGFRSSQIIEIIKLMTSASGKYIQSDTHKVIHNRQFLIITQNTTEESDLLLVDHVPMTISVENGEFSFSIVNNIDLKSATEHTAFINFDSISLPLVIRKKRIGDYFYPLGMGMKKKKVSRYLIDQKVPIHLKEQVWIVENDKKIVWLSGFRLDERFKIKDNTKKMLQIQFLPK